jgi:hypothetical protein
MSYIGNQLTSVPHIVDLYNGNGVVTAFGTLSRSPAGTAAIAVFVNGIYQVPGIDFTLNGSVINFVTAPGSGTNNIAIHHLGNGTSTQVPSDGSVTGNKIATTAVSGNNIVANAIRGNNIVAGTITGNLIADGAISGNNIVANAIRGNNIVAGTITGNLIAAQTITGDDLASNAIRGNNIVAGTITSNHFSSSANTKISSSGIVGSIIFGG